MNSKLNNEQRELAKIVYDNEKILLTLINNTLYFSKIEMGRLQFNQQWFDIVKLIENTV